MRPFLQTGHLSDPLWWEESVFCMPDYLPVVSLFESCLMWIPFRYIYRETT